MVLSTQVSPKSEILSYLGVEKQLEADTFRIDSTYEYFKSCEYELLTPSELGDMSSSFFVELKKNSSFFHSRDLRARIL